MSTEPTNGPTRAESIVSSALALIDAEGLEALTMRRLATSLGLKLPAIYRVFANKQAILDGAAEAVLGRVQMPPQGVGSWQDEMLALAQGLRAAILSQRDGARIVGGSYTAHRNTLALADRLVGVMERAGLTSQSALWATTTVFCYVLGETLEQQGASAGAADRLNSIIDRHAYPHLFATPTDQLTSFDDRFAFGITMFAGGLRELSGASTG